MDLFNLAYDNDVSNLQKHIDFVGIKDIRGKTLLHYAVLGSSLDVIDYLLNQEIDLNQKDHLGETALFDCARKAKVNIAKRLLSKYARVDIKNNHGETPLHLAAEKGNLDMIKLLVEYKADLNVLTNDDKLPVHYAILAGHLDVVIYLLEQAKQSYFYLDSSQDSFLHYACKTTNEQLVAFFLNHQLDPNLLNDSYETPLFNAVRTGKKEIVTLLLKHDAFIEIYNRRYETPLNLAKYHHDQVILDVLTSWQHTPKYIELMTKQSLTIAVLNRDHTKLRNLVDSGHIMTKDRLKKNALDYAQNYKLSACVHVLRRLNS